MIHLNFAGGRETFQIERVQIIAANNGVFLRVTTPFTVIHSSLYSPIRDSARKIENRWQVDGLDCNLSCRNVEFVTGVRRPAILTQLLVDLYFPLNYAIDISFQRYIPTDGAFVMPFTGNANIAERQTAGFPLSANGRNVRQHRHVAAATVPRQVREISETEIEGESATTITNIDATTLNAPEQEVRPPNGQRSTEQKTEANFLRRFDNIVTDDDP